MVGDPKHLNDLARIEADVRFVCRACSMQWDTDQHALARELIRAGGSLVWTEITRGMRCRRSGCGSTSLQAMPVPFSKRPLHSLRPLDHAQVQAAVATLRRATARPVAQRIGTVDVRLALLVVHRYLRDRELVAEFWLLASARDRRSGTSCDGQLRLIEARLRERGFAVRPFLP